MAANAWDDPAYLQAVDGFERAGVDVEVERMLAARIDARQTRGPDILDDRDARLGMAADQLQPVSEDDWIWLDRVMRGEAPPEGELSDLIISPGGEVVEIPTRAMRAARDAFYAGRSISEALVAAGVEAVDVEMLVSVVDSLDTEQIGLMHNEDWARGEAYVHPPRILAADVETGFIEVPAQDFYVGLGALRLFGPDEVADMLPQHDPEAIQALLDEYDRVRDLSPQSWVGDNPPDWLEAIEAEAARGGDLDDGRRLFYDEGSERRIWDEVAHDLPVTTELAGPALAEATIETEYERSVERSVWVEDAPLFIEDDRQLDIDIDIDF